jgi:hypothetical protein
MQSSESKVNHTEETAIQWRKKSEMAQHYRCNVRTITSLMQRRVLPYVRIGRFVRFNLTECDKAMLKYERCSALL